MPKLADFLDPVLASDDCRTLPPASQGTARANVVAELARLDALGVVMSGEDRIIDADCSVKRAPRSLTHCHCLTHSRRQGLWLLSRGRRLSPLETLCLQGVRHCDWVWKMSNTQIYGAAGNSMSVPILVLVLQQICRVLPISVGRRILILLTNRGALVDETLQ